MSSKRKHSGLEGAIRPGLVKLMRVLSGLAMVVAVYLVWTSLSKGNVVGCGPESGCHEVLRSRWSSWFGVPVSLFGFLAYLAFFVGTFRLGPRASAAEQRQVWRVLLPCAILIAGGAIWFTGIQMFVLRTFCPYCLTTHSAALVAAVVLLFHVPWAPEPDKPWQKEKQVYLAPALARKLVWAGSAGLVVFATGQLLHQPITYLVRHGGGASGVQTNAQAVRIMQLFDGRVELNLSEVPLVGNPQAPHLVVDLHDYTCRGCRGMHQPLKTLHQTFSNELAIVSLPMPLDSTCNHRVPQTPKAHSNACAYAKISLAVWRAKPAALGTFEDWVYTPPLPPPVAETLKFAQQLVGEQALQTALQDSWITNQLQKSIAIYGLNMDLNKNSSMPQFIIGTNVVFGSIPLDTLFMNVTNQFGLRLPPSAATAAGSKPPGNG